MRGSPYLSPKVSFWREGGNPERDEVNSLPRVMHKRETGR